LIFIHLFLCLCIINEDHYIYINSTNLRGVIIKRFDITKKDIELVEVATKKITMLYEDDKHHVGAAIRKKIGECISAVHIESYIERVRGCKEEIAIGCGFRMDKRILTRLLRLDPYSDLKIRKENYYI
jgi:cytidine deaminase